ncbi:MAG TPA: ABC transporter permease, partial [Candidatus Acidoferrum sp.]|nr:ABC transporter permease [Candidatus Acidoferrum sp.]
GDFVAVDHVSFKIARGEIFGFLGSNGCGKSTTMKMLVGFLPASSGTCKLFGEPMGSNDMQARRNVGYMTQAFSLYGELTVAQNLELHAQLYHLPPEKVAGRIEDLLERYDLKSVVNSRPDSLPLGMKQRLQLAVAVLHEPSILILDEPTSGVDPIARDAFWRTLIDLSRDEGVTIFVTTHFMNEADRCDRISLMHAGKVLAVGAPQELVRERGSASLEDCFVGYLAEAAGIDMSKKAEAPAPAVAEVVATERPKRFKIGRLWAYARRETVELLRDPIRLAFALVGPIILMFAFGYGISFDIENLQTASFDQDETPESRELLQGFDGSRYFAVQPPIKTPDDMERRLRSGNTQIVVEVPPGFGRDLLNNRTPEVDATVDGAMTFRGETSKNYVTRVIRKQGEELQRSLHRAGSPNAWNSEDIQTRFRYNQAFLSVNAMVPSIFMLLLCLIPAIMSAIAVVREKETGSIANFRSTPVTGLEFLVGKQAPYAATAFVSFLTLALLALLVFGLPIKGSALALVSGAALYVLASTAFGLLMSSFVRTQVAAIFGTAIITLIPATNFSGMLTPVSALTGGGRVLGLAFPSSWFQQISVGAFTKGLGFPELWHSHVMLGVFAVVFIAAARLALRKQER